MTDGKDNKNVIDLNDEKDVKALNQKELEAALILIYKSGSLTEKEIQILKSFHELIKRESNKRNTTPLELIKYFEKNKKELMKLLEKPRVKKLLPKFEKVYIHSEIENVLRTVLKTQRLKDNGISIIEDDFMTGQEVNTWENKGVEYLIKVEDLLKFEGKPPKVYISQFKNISLLMGMIQEQQFSNDTKEAKCEFSLSYYAERRGYTKEEIQQGGYFKELKRDLLTGAYTTYRIDKIIIEGKKYTAHGIPNFYILYEPEDRRDNWKVEFNNPYSNWITKILNGEPGQQYFISNHKAIEDRITTEKPYLFLFYQQLTKRKREILITTPVKIVNLLADMKIDEQILARPKECFELLKECLIYFSINYQPVPELESFNIYNDFHKTKTLKLPLHISEAFKQYPYEDFKDDLKDIGIKDIREAYISFKRPYVKPEAKFIEFILTGEDKQLIEEILDWATEWEEYEEGHKVPFTEEERYKFLSDCIRYLGHEKLQHSFTEEHARENPGGFHGAYHVDNPIGYFTKRLPELLKEDKETRAK